ncbi:MAG TPA: tetratricopeptide repeat protein [Vicinamibacterales bacterium]
MNASRARRSVQPADPTRQGWTARWWILVPLVAAVVLKAAVLTQLAGHPLLAPDAGLDTTAYVQLARQVLDGHPGLGPGLYYVSPFYIYFLAAILGVSHSFLAVRIVQVAMGTAAVGLVCLLARQWFGERAALAAGVLAAFTGLFTFYEVLILQSSVDVFFTAAALWCVALGVSSRDRAGVRLLPIFGAGLLWGVETLNRPNVLLAAVALAVVMWIALRRIKFPLALAAGLLLGMAPVAIRNVVVTREWTLVSSHGGLNFYIGNNADATGFYRPVPGVRPAIVGQEIDTRRLATEALGHPATDAEVSSYFFQLAWTWIRAHPLDAALLFAKKFAFAFHAAHLALPLSYAFFAYDTPGWLRFLFVGPWLLVPLGITGAVWRLARSPTPDAGFEVSRPGFVIWLSFVPLYGAAVAFFFVADRYRLPLLVPLCVCAGGGLDLGIEAARQRDVRRLAYATAALAAAFIVVNWPTRWLDDGRWTDGLRTAERLVIAQRDDEAERWAAWLDTHNPPHAGAGQLGVAQQWMALQQYQRALPYLQRAERADPAEPHAQYALGQALLKLGRAPDALVHLQRGFEAGIELPGGGDDYAQALVDTGDLAGAAAALRRIHPAASADAEVWLRLGRLAMEARVPDVAEPFFRQAVAMQPEAAAARQQYGLALLVLDRFEDAARELGAAARVNPADADTLSRLAYAEYRLGRLDDARRHARATLAIDPNDRLARELTAAMANRAK